MGFMDKDRFLCYKYIDILKIYMKSWETCESLYNTVPYSMVWDIYI